MSRWHSALLFLSACSTDTFTTDDSGTTDASGDVRDAVVEACTPSATSCPPNEICTSFDNGQIGSFVAYTIGQGTQTISPEHFVSCPNGLLAHVDSTDSGSALSFGGIAGTFALASLPAASATLHAQVMLPSSLTAQLVIIADITVNQLSSTAVSLAFVNSGWQLGGGGTSATMNPLTGEWMAITLHVDFTTTAAGSVATLDYIDKSHQTKQAMIKFPALQPASFTITSIDGTIGIGAAGPTGAAQAFVDDVSFGPQ